jgi:hypothetical protein
MEALSHRRGMNLGKEARLYSTLQMFETLTGFTFDPSNPNFRDAINVCRSELELYRYRCSGLVNEVQERQSIPFSVMIGTFGHGSPNVTLVPACPDAVSHARFFHAGVACLFQKPRSTVKRMIATNTSAIVLMAQAPQAFPCCS